MCWIFQEQLTLALTSVWLFHLKSHITFMPHYVLSHHTSCIVTLNMKCCFVVLSITLSCIPLRSYNAIFIKLTCKFHYAITLLRVLCYLMSCWDDMLAGYIHANFHWLNIDPKIRRPLQIQWRAPPVHHNIVILSFWRISQSCSRKKIMYSKVVCFPLSFNQNDHHQGEYKTVTSELFCAH